MFESSGRKCRGCKPLINHKPCHRQSGAFFTVSPVSFDLTSSFSPAFPDGEAGYNCLTIGASLHDAPSTCRSFLLGQAPTAPEPERRHPPPRSQPHRPQAGPLPAPADLPARFSGADTAVAGPKRCRLARTQPWRDLSAIVWRRHGRGGTKTLSFGADTVVAGPRRSRLVRTRPWQDLRAIVWCRHGRGRTKKASV